MMAEEITTLLRGSGLPVVYGCWKEPPAMPYLVWQEVNTTNFYADGTVYYHKSRIQAELYTETKDPAAENALENALQGIAWEKTGAEWLENENCYQQIYEFEVM